MTAGVAHPWGVMPPVRRSGVVLIYPARPAATHSAVAGKGPVTAETPVLDALAELTAASAEHLSVAPREFMLLTLAAPIAADAPPASYPANVDAATAGGVTADDIQGVMISVARLGARRGWSRQAGTSQGSALGDRGGQLRNALGNRGG